MTGHTMVFWMKEPPFSGIAPTVKVPLMMYTSSVARGCVWGAAK